MVRIVFGTFKYPATIQLQYQIHDHVRGAQQVKVSE